MKGDKEIEMTDMNDEKETDIDAEIEKAEVKMVSFGELVSLWFKLCPIKTQQISTESLAPHADDLCLYTAQVESGPDHLGLLFFYRLL